MYRIGPAGTMRYPGMSRGAMTEPTSVGYRLAGPGGSSASRQIPVSPPAPIGPVIPTATASTRNPTCYLSAPMRPGTITDPSRLLPGPSGPLADHHLFSRQFEGYFQRRNIFIDEYTVTLNQDITHLRAVHGRGNMGQMPGRWNMVWEEFIRDNPNASATETYQQAGRMMDDFGLSGAEIHPYGQR